MPSMAPLIGALPKLRQMAESLMSDQCAVKEKVHECSCKVQTSGVLASEQTEGSAAQAMGAVSLVWSLYVHFPYGTPGLRAGDVVEVTESANQLLAGSRFRLVSPQSEKTHATACRWNVKEDS